MPIICTDVIIPKAVPNAAGSITRGTDGHKLALEKESILIVYHTYIHDFTEVITLEHTILKC